MSEPRSSSGNGSGRGSLSDAELNRLIVDGIGGVVSERLERARRSSGCEHVDRLNSYEVSRGPDVRVEGRSDSTWTSVVEHRCFTCRRIAAHTVETWEPSIAGTGGYLHRIDVVQLTLPEGWTW